ncbi:MAG TPA: 3-dehydroquinate synthase [Nitrospiria bacterium]
MVQNILIKVKTLTGEYPIFLGWKTLGHIQDYFKKTGNQGKVGIVTNSKVKKLYFKELYREVQESGLKPYLFCLPDGERFKTLHSVEKIYNGLIKAKFERGSTLIGLGGGVIGDMAGFAAATFLRGISLIHIPTTLVAQVDSSIGGKTGVDHQFGKNLIGSFYSPKSVFSDVSTLRTLSKREFNGGLAEVIKYGVISDRRLLEILESEVQPNSEMKPKILIEIVKRSCQIKAKIVSKDERESGLRRILNYGHTLGHALETLTCYKKFKHGEAIAIGMVFASRLAHYLGLCSEDLINRQIRLLKKFNLPTQFLIGSPEKLFEIMSVDKKVRQGKIYFVLPVRMGKVVIQSVEKRHIMHVLRADGKKILG